MRLHTYQANKSLTLPIILLWLTLTLVACSTAENPSGSPIIPTASQPPPTIAPTPAPTATEIPLQGTLTIWHSWEENQMPVFEEILHNFSQNYPDILLDILYIPSIDLPRRLELAMMEGITPSLILGPAEWGEELFDKGLIQPITSQIDSKILNRLNKPALEAAFLQGELASVPYAISGVVLYRNKDYITIQADTLEELINIAQTMNTDDFRGAILERGFLYSGGHLVGLGGKWVDEKGNPAFLSNTGIQWITLLQNLEQAGETSFLSDEDLELFKAGKVGWIIDGTWNLRQIAEQIGVDSLAIDPWPSAGSGSMSGFVFSENIFVTANTTGQQLSLAKAFIEFFLSQESQTILAGSTKIPASSGITITDPMYGSLTTQAMTALAGGAAALPSSKFEAYQINLNIALKEIFQDGISPDVALQTAVEAITLETSGQTLETTATPENQ